MQTHQDKVKATVDQAHQQADEASKGMNMADSYYVRSRIFDRMKEHLDELSQEECKRHRK